MTRGTVRWMAIELLTSSQDDDDASAHNEKTDLWAFGMVVLEVGFLSFYMVYSLDLETAR